MAKATLILGGMGGAVGLIFGTLVLSDVWEPVP